MTETTNFTNRFECVLHRFFEAPLIIFLSGIWAATVGKSMEAESYISAAIFLIVSFTTYVVAAGSIHRKTESLETVRDIAWSKVEEHADRADRAEAALARVEAVIGRTARHYSHDDEPRHDREEDA